MTLTRKQLERMGSKDTYPSVVAARDRVQVIQQTLVDLEAEWQTLDARRGSATSGAELRDIRERKLAVPGEILDARTDLKMGLQEVADACAQAHEAARPAIQEALDEALSRAPAALEQVRALTAELRAICKIDSAWRVSVSSYVAKSALPMGFETGVGLLERAEETFRTQTLPFARREPAAVK